MPLYSAQVLSDPRVQAALQLQNGSGGGNVGLYGVGLKASPVLTTQQRLQSSPVYQAGQVGDTSPMESGAQYDMARESIPGLADEAASAAPTAARAVTGPGAIGGAATPLTSAGEGLGADAAGGAGLLSSLWKGGPSGVRGALAEAAPEGFSLGGALGGVASGAAPGLLIDAAGNIIDDGKKQSTRHDVGSAVKGFGLGAAGAGAGAGLLGALGVEGAAGPPGWIAAGLTGAAYGGYKLYEAITGHDDAGGKGDKSDIHAAYSTGWKKIDQYAHDAGILNGNFISSVKDNYNSILQSAKDPTDKKVQKAALQQAQQLVMQFGVQRDQEDQQSRNMLAAQGYAQRTLGPYIDANNQYSNMATAAYQQLANSGGTPQAKALANASGATFQQNAAAQNANITAGAVNAPMLYQQQQSMIAQYQQQLAAAQQATRDARSGTSSSGI